MVISSFFREIFDHVTCISSQIQTHVDDLQISHKPRFRLITNRRAIGDVKLKGCKCSLFFMVLTAVPIFLSPMKITLLGYKFQNTAFT